MVGRRQRRGKPWVKKSRLEVDNEANASHRAEPEGPSIGKMKSETMKQRRRKRYIREEKRKERKKKKER